jgi:uncharacterized membrane protein
VPHARGTPERLSMFSDGVFAVLITVLVLELRPPELPTFRALFLLWPTWLSYAVSYLFIAIVWINHHHLLRYATEATPRLMWFNFAHLFSVSLLPVSTAWMAVSKLAPQPVAFYAAVFFFVNATYMALIWELLERSPVKEVSPKKRRVMRFRSIARVQTLAILFGVNVAAYLYTPPLMRGAAVGLLSLLRNEGGSVGTSMAQTLQERREQFHTLRLGESLDPFNPAVQSFLEQAQARFLQQTGDPAVAQQLAWQALENLRHQQASALAYFDCFWLFAVVVLAVTLVVFLMKRSVAEKGARIGGE